MKELTIVAQNKVGLLAKISEAVSSLGVNIEAITAYEKNNNAVFRIVTNDVSTAMKALSKFSDVTITQQPVLIVKLSNRPGELAKLTRKLANRSINLETVYIVSKKNDFTEVAIKPVETDFEKTKEVLGL